MKKLKPNDGMTLEDAKAAASDLEAILLNFDRFYAGGRGTATTTTTQRS